MDYKQKVMLKNVHFAFKLGDYTMVKAVHAFHAV